MKTLCLDGVFNQDELFWLYNNLLGCSYVRLTTNIVIKK